MKQGDLNKKILAQNEEIILCAYLANSIIIIIIINICNLYICLVIYLFYLVSFVCIYLRSYMYFFVPSCIKYIIIIIYITL
jgi:hypothetical protein